MSRRGPNLNRRADLEAALARCKPGDVISLQDLATLYGTSKQNFTNLLRQIERMFDMPAWTIGPRGIHVYPAAKAIRVIIAYEKRNDAQAATLQERTARILGNGKRKPGAAQDAMLPISEMAVASRVMAETEQRERDQGLHTSLADQASTAGEVFGMISGFLSELEAEIDPNGELPMKVRAKLREGGNKLALKIHGRMKDMLSGNAVPKSQRPKGARAKDGRARRSSPGRARA